MSIQIVGHRGAAALAPENTLPAFEAALAAGVTMVETDVRLTRDHRLVCFHDDRLDRLTSMQGMVADQDWSELRELTILPGSFGGRFPEARIPLLEELIRALPETTRLCIEIKADPSRPGDVTRATLECLRDAGALNRTRIIAFDIEDLRAVRRLAVEDPTLAPAELGILVGRAQLPYWKVWAREQSADVVHFEHRLVLANGSLVGEAQDDGYRVNAWTVHDAGLAAALTATGVCELTTDDPLQLSRIQLPNT